MNLLTGARTSAEVCWGREIKDKLLYRLKNELLEWLPSVLERGQVETNEAEQRIAELEWMVGQLALENEV